MIARATIPAVALLLGLTATAQAPTSLKAAFKSDFYIGVAMNTAQITGQDASGDALIAGQFNSISPENCLKWENVHPEPGRYDFSISDQYVAFGQKHRMFILGHNLVWHSQVPAWVFHDSKGNLLARDALLARMKDHIDTVVGRYKGRIQTWDVVNEALNEDGTLRQSLWYKIIGPDYIQKAFEYAHQADPAAQLNYNDYNIENPAKRNGAIALVKQLQAAGIPIATIGIQEHDSLDFPTLDQLNDTIEAFGKLGVKVAITELDVDVLPRATPQQTADVSAGVSTRAAQNPALNPWPNGLPNNVQQRLTKRYADLFAVYLKHRDVINRVTLWGLTDADSWKNNWPVPGRTNYPLLFDRSDRPKPAYYAVIQEAAARP